MCSVERKSEYGGDWPLTENEISILDTNQESLVDLVDCSELLVRLYSAQVINRRQRDAISSEPTDLKKNEVLLDILRRSSIDDYRQVVRCLHESNQSHVAKKLDEGGGRFSTSYACIYVCNRVRVYVCMGVWMEVKNSRGIVPSILGSFYCIYLSFSF